MELKLRVVPKEVFTVMNLDDTFRHLWVPDNVLSLIGLGTSYLLEFFEFYGQRISTFYDRYVKDTEFEDDRFNAFISQEKRHAAAHKQLNAFIAKNRTPPSREKYHPRVYDFMYVTYKEFAEPIISGLIRDEAAGKTLDSPHFKEALKHIAIFETEVCMASFSFFDNLIDKGRLEYMMELSENLGVLYLLGYHYCEEMEHCHISIAAYEKIFKEQLWSKEQVREYARDADILSHRVMVATLMVGQMLGVDVTVRQIQSMLPDYKALATEGFNARSPEVWEKTRYLVKRWDEEWEPMLLARIREQVSASGKAIPD